MKAKLLPVLLIGLLLAGCSGLIASHSIAPQIDTDAALMTARVTTTQPAVALADNAKAFDGYYATATINPFAFWFGPKQLLVNATIYADLQGKAIRADEYASRAASQPALVNNRSRLQMESEWMHNIKREKDGN